MGYAIRNTLYGGYHRFSETQFADFSRNTIRRNPVHPQFRFIENRFTETTTMPRKIIELGG